MAAFLSDTLSVAGLHCYQYIYIYIIYILYEQCYTLKSSMSYNNICLFNVND